ncbi:MAG TPA: UDP-N-acetylglucosamine 2-epimerase (non-hydrolyzing), partial [Chloroflexi bacterium]|nr:UDP-N-acetylglucosamine 2-epimerase (non-hydrolyzing) [Chloroflexota bacterium]
VVADLHFAPTEWSRQNLLRENTPDEHIVVTGNPAIDALHWVVQQPFDFKTIDLPLAASTNRLVLVTAHRRE